VIQDFKPYPLLSAFQQKEFDLVFVFAKSQKRVLYWELQSL